MGTEGQRDERTEGKECEDSTRRRRRPLSEGDLAALRERVTTQPGVPAAELVALMAERGTTVSATAVSKALGEMGFRKVRRQRPPSMPTPQTAPRYTTAHRREPTATMYPSSLTDAEWAILEPVLEASRDPRGCKPKHDRRQMMDAVFYLVRSGCQ